MIFVCSFLSWFLFLCYYIRCIYVLQRYDDDLVFLRVVIRFVYFLV